MRIDRLGVINGLRGIAILGIVFHHSFFDYFKYGAAENSTPWMIDVVASSCWLGVNLFFFLSGFVLYLPYAQGKRRCASRTDITHFYRRRFLRLIPLYTFVWVFSVVFMTDLQPTQLQFYKAVLLYGTCLYPFYPGWFFPPGNWVLWSLGAEIWFSVLFPFLAIVIGWLGWARSLVLVVVAALVVRLVGQSIFGAPDVPLNMISDSVFGRLDEFVLGMFASHLYQKGVRGAPTVAVGGLVLGFVGAFIWAWRYQGWLPPVSGAFANNFVDAGMLLTTLALLTVPRWWSSALEARWLQLLGAMCYSIYVWHGIVQLRFGASLHAGILEYASYLGMVFVLSAFTFRYIEFRAAASWRDLISQTAGAVSERGQRVTQSSS